MAEAIPEINGITLLLGLRGDGHLRTLRSHRPLILLANCLHLRITITHFLVRHGIRAVLTEELASVIGKNIRISQNGLISTMLV